MEEKADQARLVIGAGARCLKCDYLLNDLTEPRCPECGREFDPLDSSTYSTYGAPYPAWARWLARPPGLVFALLPLVPIGITLWEIRRPGGDFNAQIGGFAILALIGILWFLRGVTFLGILNWFLRPISEQKKGWIRWCILPAEVALWFVIVGNEDAIQRAVFDLSETKLHAIASRPTLPTNPVWTGLLEVRRADRYRGGVLLLTGSGYDACACGYAYFPDRNPTDTDTLRFRPMKGRWWSYYDYADPRYTLTRSAPPWSESATTQPSAKNQ